MTSQFRTNQSMKTVYFERHQTFQKINFITLFTKITAYDRAGWTASASCKCITVILGVIILIHFEFEIYNYDLT